MVKKALLGLLAVVVVIGFLLAKDWDSPELGRSLLAKASEGTGMEMTAEGFRLNLLSGITLDNVKGSQRTEERELTFSLDRLVFEHRVMPLLSGTVAVDRVVVEAPVIELVESGTGEAMEEGAPESSDREADAARSEEQVPEDEEAEAGSGLALEVQEIRIVDATLLMKQAGQSGEGTRIEGLDFSVDDFTLDPRVRSLAGLSAEGTLTVENVTFDSLQVSETDSRFMLADGKFEMPELTFRTPHGSFEAKMTVDFNPTPFTYRLEALGDPLDLNSLMGEGEGFGPGHVELKADGAGSESSDVVADGGMQLSEGKFPETAMFTGIDKAVGKNVVAGVPYEATEATFHLEDNRLVLAPFRFKSENVRLDLSGWVDLAGPLELQVALATPREGVQIEGVGSTALDLLADDEGWVPVPITISGTLEEPRVRPDARALAAQAGQGAKREATEKATDALKGLLRRKK